MVFNLLPWCLRRMTRVACPYQAEYLELWANRLMGLDASGLGWELLSGLGRVKMVPSSCLLLSKYHVSMCPRRKMSGLCDPGLCSLPLGLAKRKA